MSSAMRIPEAVQWHEGMLLAPPHFQQAQRRSEALLAYQMLAASPFHWGVRHLLVDTRLLLEGLFRVVELEAILPDGLIVSHPLPAASALQLDLTAVDLDLARSPAAIHLCVAAQAATLDVGGVRRYQSVEGEATPDENTGDGEVAIPRLRPAPHLFATESPLRPPPNLYVSLPIALVGLRDEAFVLANYAPPSLAVTAGGPLYGIADSVAHRLREKAMALSERLQGSGSGSDHAAAAESWVEVRALMQALPRLEILLASGAAHPFAIYLALGDVIGSLACLGNQPCPPQPPAYAHAHPLPAFRTLAEAIERSIERLHEPYRAIRFVQAGHRFQLPVEADWLAGAELVVGARVPPGQPPTAVAEWVGQALIAGSSRIHSVRSRRISGLARRSIEHAAELRLLPPRNVLLFALNIDADLIPADDLLIIESPLGREGPAQPSELVLYRPAETKQEAGALATPTIDAGGGR